jgi:outer membrane protein assembly factor BamA
MRASLGFGATFDTDYGVVEFYYTPLVFKQKYEKYSEFQINIGID